MTNRKVLAKYHERKTIQDKEGRICDAPDCSTILSRYNKTDVCALHEMKATEERYGWRPR